MALTSSITKYLGPRKGAGGVRTNIVRFTCDTDYPDGGYPVTAALCGFNTAVYAVVPLGLVHDATTTSADTAWVASYDQVSAKLQVFDSGGGASTNPPGEVADGLNNISGLVVDALCMGL